MDQLSGKDRESAPGSGEGPREKLLDYLAMHHVMTLATTGSNGPWAAAVFYVNSGTTLYFLSSPGSRHCLNLAHSPLVAATIQEDYSDWPQIKGVQLDGMVSELAGSEETEARRLYAKKFPIVGLAGKAPAAIVKALARVRWYRLLPQHMHFIDNAAGFGQRADIDVG